MSSLGDTLRERRAALGVSLQQAEDATKIRRRILQALENGDHKILPNAGYVRGFISSYARFLELDPQPLLQMYKAETGNTPHRDRGYPQVAEAVKPTGQQHAVPWGGAVAAVIAIIVVSLLIWVVSRVGRESDTLPPVPVVPQETTSSGTSPTQPVAVEKDAPADKALPFTVDVSVATNGASWVRVTIDGKKAYEGTLAGGQSKEFQAAKTASVRVGKPSVVTVMKDGVKIAIPDGDSPTVTLKATQPK